MFLTNLDYFILAFSVFFGLIFFLLGLEKLHKFYFGLIMGFFFFIITNLHIKVLSTESSIQNGKNIGSSILSDGSFFLVNKSFILSFSTFFIFVLGIMLISSDIISFNVKNNKLTSLLFGLLLPFFIISILVYVYLNSFVPVSYVTDFFNFFSDSFFVSYLSDKPYLSLYFVYILIGFRLFFRVFVSFLIYLLNEIRKERKQ